MSTTAAPFEPSTAGRPASDAPSFVGTWVATAADGAHLIEQFPARLEVSGNVVAATAGCRLITTTVTTPKDVASDPAAELVGGPDVAVEHQITCSPELNALDNWLTELLTGPMRWEQSDDVLVVSAADQPAGSLRLTRVLLPSTTDPTTFDDPGLEGTYLLTQWTQPAVASPSESAAPHSTTGAAYPAAPTLQLSFADGRLTADGICGTSTGAYRLTAGALQVSDLSTLHDPAVPCDPSAQQFDKLILGLLAARPILERNGDQVALTSRNGDFGIAINRVAVPADTAFAGTWTLQQYQRSGDQPIRLPPEIIATVSYNEGQLAASAGCNYLNGAAYVADGVIRAENFMSTAMACGPPLDEIDQAIMDAFSSGSSLYTIDGGVLTISSPSITLILTR